MQPRLHGMDVRSPVIALSCYVCGKGLKETFSLVTMSGGVDRVFVAHETCTLRCYDALFIPVRREKVEQSATAVRAPKR